MWFRIVYTMLCAVWCTVGMWERVLMQNMHNLVENDSHLHPGYSGFSLLGFTLTRFPLSVYP
jgi:hypothetical protein